LSVVATLFAATSGFAVLPQSPRRAASPLAMAPPEKKKGNIFTAFKEEMDSFVDDAINRRLGAGAQYYGKRKSSFYGAGDKGKKKDRNVFDNEEDYRGPANAGYFKWMWDDETGQMIPVTRMKEKNVEKRIR